MESANDFKVDDVDDSDSASSSPCTEVSTSHAMNDCSKQAEAFLERQGGKIHPIFEAEEKYLQQRSSPPKMHIFE